MAVGAVAYSHWAPTKRHFGFPWAEIGVNLFFVLSGFLITGILLGCRKYGDPLFSVRAFYARRLLRLIPAFYAVLLTGYVFDVRPMRETILWHCTYLSNIYFFWINDWNGPISHFWSLAVEEQFYFLWPAVVLGLSARRIGPAIALLIIVGLASQMLLPMLLPDVRLFTVLPVSSFDALGVGALLAWTKWTRGSDSRRPTWLVVALPVYAALVFARNTGSTSPPLRLAERLSMLATLYWLTDSAAVGFGGRIGRLLESRPLLFLGRISYGLYLMHNFASIPVRWFAHAIGFPSLQFGASGIALMTVFTFAAAAISWQLLEAPLNSLKRAFPYDPRQAAFAKSKSDLRLKGSGVAEDRPLAARA